MKSPARDFDEKHFYLAEFRGRSLGIALPRISAATGEDLKPILQELAANGTRCILFGLDAQTLEELATEVVEGTHDPDWPGKVWSGLGQKPHVGLWLAGDSPRELPSGEFARRCGDAVLQLRLAKLIWLDERGWLQDGQGRRLSLVDLHGLESQVVGMAEGESHFQAVLGEFKRMLEGGLPSISLCSADRLEEELFTYAGSGTLFARERYVQVRSLGLDDFDNAANLIERGVEEGFLAPRGPSELERLLATGFGVFIEGRYLAGIASLVSYPQDGFCEIVGLYTLTRFKGEGVGVQLVRFAQEQTQALGCQRLFACTTSERVETFFLQQGFEPASVENVPPSKWLNYAEDRQSIVRVISWQAP